VTRDLSRSAGAIGAVNNRTRRTAVAERIVTPPSDPCAFSVVRQVHPNGTLDTVRNHTPETVQELHGATLVRWSFRCPCGSTWILERPR
jgi:hypothetical protein